MNGLRILYKSIREGIRMLFSHEYDFNINDRSTKKENTFSHFDMYIQNQQVARDRTLSIHSGVWVYVYM